MLYLFLKMLLLLQYLILVILFTTMLLTGLIVNIVQCLLYFGLRPWNKYLFRKINYYLCYTFYCQIHCVIDWYSKSEIYVYVDKEELKYFGKEHACVIMNHTYEIDWVFLANVSEKFGIAGNFKAFVKKIVQYLPSLGWSMYFSENIVLERSYDKDKENIRKKLIENLEYPDPIWLFLSPEGTRFSERKHAESVKFAKEKGLPILKHHLLPKPKGFLTSVPVLRTKSVPIYDVTISVSQKDKIKPTMLNVGLGKKVKVHLYIKRIPIENVPSDDEKATEFLNNIFIQKDKLRDSFYKTEDYFKESNVKRVEPFKTKKRFVTLINLVVWNIILLGLILYYTVHYGKISYIIGFLLFICSMFKFALEMNKLKK